MLLFHMERHDYRVLRDCWVPDQGGYRSDSSAASGVSAAGPMDIYIDKLCSGQRVVTCHRPFHNTETVLKDLPGWTV